MSSMTFCSLLGGCLAARWNRLTSQKAKKINAINSIHLLIMTGSLRLS